MQSGTHKRTGITTLCSIALLLTTAIPSYSGAITDSFQSVVNQVTDQEFICEGYDVVELFRVETIENLEASLTDGYPMPWLQEILNDESIPEEDRYWLDCKVRAVFAQDLHLFFDREGNPVHVEADWIRYGESYWQEHFIVNPPGEYSREETNPATGLWGETGFVYNRFGEQTGRLALCEDGMYLSRDGSVGLLVHRGTEHVTEYSPVCLYFVYSDGSYYKNPDELWTYDYTLSQSGEYALLVQRIQNGPDLIQMFDRSGNIVWEQEATGRTVTNTEPIILPGDEVCAIPSVTLDPTTHYSQIFAVDTGTNLCNLIEDNTRYSYSSNGDYLCICNSCYSALAHNVIWDIGEYLETNQSVYRLSCTNNADMFSALLRTRVDTLSVHASLVVVTEDGKWLLKEEANQDQGVLLSPSGIIAFSHQMSRYCWRSSIPCNIWRIGGKQ